MTAFFVVYQNRVRRTAPEELEVFKLASWAEIAGYEGLYLISDEGKVISLPRRVVGYRTFMRKARLLGNHLRGKGTHKYEFVALTKNGETKYHSVHRLVAEAFLPNPCNLPEVNHKDQNPLNNRVENLEWCTRQYNIEYSKNVPVYQFSDDGKVTRHKSATAASEATGIGRRNICNALNGWSKTAGGYVWQYAND